MSDIQTYSWNRTIAGVAGAVYGILQKHCKELAINEQLIKSSNPLHIFICRTNLENEHGGPTFLTIYHFLYTLFKQASIEPECMIAALLYLQQFLEKTALPFTAASWERLTFTCVLIASKSWDDVSCSSRSFSLCNSALTLRDLNAMERLVLAWLDFRLNVTSGMYRKVYYELKDISSLLVIDARSGNPIPRSPQLVQQMGVRPFFGASYIFGVGRAVLQDSVCRAENRGSSCELLCSRDPLDFAAAALESGQGLGRRVTVA
ncbi:Cyclin PHO80-like [Carpediemonas membranifera]|uniref:Cyclin PHO80-like n=1 Tax=Carpediemonas membranifera TaxID=201153 RepID=A0A8J6EA97_9EUKA|nr:Cyclin PHO80-like [Carpediemonas membranifera]|eukprot:KAG9394390.1 Cyclin PHO80-like [Carpediemonas membranifera]